MVNIVNNKSIAYNEVFNVLQKLETEKICNIPIEIIEFLDKERLEDTQNLYSGFDNNGDIKVNSEAEKILIYLFLKYLATNEEREELKEKFFYPI